MKCYDMLLMMLLWPNKYHRQHVTVNKLLIIRNRVNLIQLLQFNINNLMTLHNTLIFVFLFLSLNFIDIVKKVNCKCVFALLGLLIVRTSTIMIIVLFFVF